MSVNLESHDLLLKKAEQIAGHIAHSETAQTYWQARDKMASHKEAQSLFDDLKKKTNGMLVLKDRVGEQSEKYQRMKDQTVQIEARLAEIPVALQYKAAQDDLNGMLQEVMHILLARLNQEVPVEVGPRQCGSGDGGSCSSCSAH
ncbi:YlbF family regulator [Alicyclobacillus fodiniaquatilis]|jgi:cell fate (sporulation/competence/biofilm development) regulator YmcA (YheA/YmcA/DUF963 family)|uniref:YlbF family regulator n=1 Tax=Alicyclobacillus fodiniaquatilis TaxID=1661150 RepID=A0ABW4JEE5_9BACL